MRCVTSPLSQSTPRIFETQRAERCSLHRLLSRRDAPDFTLVASPVHDPDERVLSAAAVVVGVRSHATRCSVPRLSNRRATTRAFRNGVWMRRRTLTDCRKDLQQHCVVTTSPATDDAGCIGEHARLCGLHRKRHCAGCTESASRVVPSTALRPSLGGRRAPFTPPPHAGLDRRRREP